MIQIRKDKKQNPNENFHKLQVERMKRTNENKITGENNRPMKFQKRLKKRDLLKAVFLLTAVLLIISKGSGLSGQEQSPSIKMKAQPAKVYLGETFYLQFYYSNFKKPTPPDLGYLSSEFDVKYLGEQNQSHSMISIVNGRQTKTQTREIVYVYRLKPKNSGTIQLEAPEVKEQNKTIQAASVLIEVIPPSEQELVRLEMKSSANEIYPLTPFAITLNVYVKELPGKYGESDPILSLGRRVEPTSLILPWLEDDKLEKGLIPAENWENWIKKYRNVRGGFIINNIRISEPLDFGFSLFDNSNRSILFLPEGEKTELTGKDGKKIRYWKYKFERTFQAEKTGNFVFDPVILKGIFAAVDVEDGLKAENVYTLSKPLTVKIKDVPSQGRPENYIGAFGSFDWSATIAPEKVQVGQALTLTLTLQGTGSLLQVKAPDLAKIPGLTDNFKIYPPYEEISGDKAVFTYSLRAVKEGSLEFPSVPISYFDVKTEKFVSLKSNPIKLDVLASKVLSNESLDLETRKGLRNNRVLTRSHEGIYADIEDSALSMNQKITLSSWLKSLSLPAAAGCFAWLILSLWGTGKFESLQKKREIQQQGQRLFSEGMKGLLPGSQNSLSASNHSESEQPNFDRSASAVSKIRSAFLLPLNGFFNKSPETLSASEIDQLLDRFLAHKNNSKDVETLLKNVKTFFADLDRIRYGHETTVIENIRTSAPKLFNDWLDFIHSPYFKKTMKTSSSKKTKSLIMKMILPFALLSSITIFTGCSTRSDSTAAANIAEIKRLEQEAEKFENSLTNSDSSHSDNSKKNEKSNGDSLSNKKEVTEKKRDFYRKTAALYQGIRDRGIESGPLLFNQGNAFYRAGEEARALATWRTAQRYMPSDPYLKANIELLTAADSVQKKAVSEYFLFWQNKISYPMKFQFAWLGFILSIFFLLLWKLSIIQAKKISGNESATSFSSEIRREEPSDFSDNREKSLLAISSGQFGNQTAASLSTRNSPTDENSTTNEKEFTDKVLTKNPAVKKVRKVVRYGLLLALIFFGVMTYSALYDWARFDARPHGIVSTSDAVVRKGNSNRYEPVFKETLPKLSETVILERRDTWCRIRLADGQEGWLPQSDLVIY